MIHEMDNPMSAHATNQKGRPHYDVPTAVTFLIAGLGIGSVLTILLSSVASHANDVRQRALASAIRGTAVP